VAKGGYFRVETTKVSFGNSRNIIELCLENSGPQTNKLSEMFREKISPGKKS
jgi:hypothetical protein